MIQGGVIKRIKRIVNQMWTCQASKLEMFITPFSPMASGVPSLLLGGVEILSESLVDADVDVGGGSTTDGLENENPFLKTSSFASVFGNEDIKCFGGGNCI